MESQPQNPESRINPENFHPCKSAFCKQTEQNQIRCRILWCLIWFCTVCQCPIKRMLGKNGLNGKMSLGDTYNYSKCSFGKYIIGYTVRKLVLQQCLSGPLNVISDSTRDVPKVLIFTL